MNSTATFNRMMQKLLEGVDHVHSYIDDICIHTETWEEHLKVLRKVLERIRDAGLTIKPSKCHIGFGTVEYLGHSTGSGEKGLNKENVEKAVTAERPVTKKQVRSLLGLTGFYRKKYPKLCYCCRSACRSHEKGLSGKSGIAGGSRTCVCHS